MKDIYKQNYLQYMKIEVYYDHRNLLEIFHLHFLSFFVIFAKYLHIFLLFFSK